MFEIPKTMLEKQFAINFGKKLLRKYLKKKPWTCIKYHVVCFHWSSVFNQSCSQAWTTSILSRAFLVLRSWLQHLGYSLSSIAWSLYMYLHTFHWLITVIVFFSHFTFYPKYWSFIMQRCTAGYQGVWPERIRPPDEVDFLKLLYGSCVHHFVGQAWKVAID